MEWNLNTCYLWPGTSVANWGACSWRDFKEKWSTTTHNHIQDDWHWTDLDQRKQNLKVGVLSNEVEHHWPWEEHVVGWTSKTSDLLQRNHKGPLVFVPEVLKWVLRCHIIEHYPIHMHWIYNEDLFETKEWFRDVSRVVEEKLVEEVSSGNHGAVDLSQVLKNITPKIIKAAITIYLFLQ